MPYIWYWCTKEIISSSQIFVYSKNSQVRQLLIRRDQKAFLLSKICGSYQNISNIKKEKKKKAQFLLLDMYLLLISVHV